jgi:hypothetical protein
MESAGPAKKRTTIDADVDETGFSVCISFQIMNGQTGDSKESLVD